MPVSQRRPRMSVLCLAVAALALVFIGCDSAATPDLDHSSGPTPTQAEQPTQQPTSPAAAPDTGGQTPTIPTPTPSQKATKQPEFTMEVRPTGHSKGGRPAATSESRMNTRLPNEGAMLAADGATGPDPAAHARR